MAGKIRLARKKPRAALLAAKNRPYSVKTGQAVLAMVRSSKGGALKDRYIYLTRERGNNKRKTMVTIGRRMAELMYSIMRSKTDYGVRAWKKPVGKTAGLVEQARISA